MTHYDIVIVGGGMVGASLALALQNTDFSIALVESFDFNIDAQPSYDDRGIAVSYGSKCIFDTIGIWPHLAHHASPINDIHISDRGHFGATRLSAKDEGVAALGYVITAKIMGKALNDALSQLNNLTVISPVSVIGVSHQTDSVLIELDDNQQLTTKLLVAADGGQSNVRQLMGLSALQHDYQQTAITANVSTQKAHQGKAFERFSETGPVALLPMSDNRSSLVWTVKPDEVETLMALPDEKFLEELQDKFGYRLGKFTRVGLKNSYPLQLTQTDQAIQHRTVFIGNAAHSLHPIAGQGFNLGLRDVAVLADVLATHKDDCGQSLALHDYKKWQQPDQDAVISSTNLLVSLFSNDNPILGHSRAAGLTLLDLCPPAKHYLSRKSMGLAKKRPRLARGISL